MQNRALPILLRRDRRYNTNLLHKDARLASWKARALTASMRLMFKFKYYLYDNMDGSDDNNDVQVITTSNMDFIFNVDRPNSTRFLRSFSYKLRSEWNNLPTSFRNFDDFEMFKLSV